jgi:hypothetical protein
LLYIDTDNDGLGNNTDYDDDNDGPSGLKEVLGTDTAPLNPDYDGDGEID